MLLSPVADGFEVSTRVYGVEVHERLDVRVRWLIPDLTKYADVDVTH